MTTQHLSSEAALDLLEGRLNTEQERLWNQHIDGCRGCSEDLGSWAKLRIAARRSNLKNAAGADLEGACNIFSQGPAEAGSKPRRVIASLIFDSFFEPVMVGARGVATAPRHLVLHAEDFDIHVQIWGERDHRQMLGQILPRTNADFADAARFHLLRKGERLETTAADDLGEFHFTDVPEGALSLQVDLPNLTVIGVLNVRENQ